MMRICTCEVTVRFDDAEVIEWLVDNEAITEDDAANGYTPTEDQIRDYAWELIERDDGEYGSISIC